MFHVVPLAVMTINDHIRKQTPKKSNSQTRGHRMLKRKRKYTDYCACARVHRPVFINQGVHTAQLDPIWLKQIENGWGTILVNTNWDSCQTVLSENS
jgi:hypothetical protein